MEKPIQTNIYLKIIQRSVRIKETKQLNTYMYNKKINLSQLMKNVLPISFYDLSFLKDKLSITTIQLSKFEINNLSALNDIYGCMYFSFTFFVFSIGFS